MKTPWSSLLQYGTGFAVITVLLVAGLILFVAVGLGILLAKMAVFIK